MLGVTENETQGHRNLVFIQRTSKPQTVMQNLFLNYDMTDCATIFTMQRSIS